MPLPEKLAAGISLEGSRKAFEPIELSDLPLQAIERAIRPLNVLLLCDDRHPNNVVSDHIQAFLNYSRNNIFIYNPIYRKKTPIELIDHFDAVIIHYSIFILGEYFLPPETAEKIARFRGLKVKFIQDEYRQINEMADKIAALGIHVLFSALRPHNIKKVYAQPKLNGVVKYATLSGYYPRNLILRGVPPMRERLLHVTYRARELPFWLGKLARIKYELATRFPELAKTHGLRYDIRARESDRIYGEDWISFICSGKAILGCEGGASIFDFDGKVERLVNDYLAKRPRADFEEVFRHVLAPYEGNIVHRALTPRVLEAMALRTALVLVRGEYAGVLEPWRDYIPLEPDFSNASQVAELLKDDAYLQQLVDSVYERIIVPGNYSMEQFIKRFDLALVRAMKLLTENDQASAGAIALPFHLPGRNSYLLRIRVSLMEAHEQTVTFLGDGVWATTVDTYKNTVATYKNMVACIRALIVSFMPAKLRAALRRLKRRWMRDQEAPLATTVDISERYWGEHNVTSHKRFTSTEESLEYFHWRNDQYIGYIDFMPVSGRDGAVIVDFGCGPGNDVVGFSVFSKPARIIAMDVSQPSLDEAEARLHLHGAKAEFIKLQEDESRLPLADNSIDYIHCSGVLMYVNDPLATLREFYRILRPTGRVRLMVYNHNSIWLHLYVAYILKFTNPAFKDLTLMEVFKRSTDGENCPINRCWTSSEFLELGRAAGFHCLHLGNAISLFEMDLLPRRFQAMQCIELPAEHRRFLMSLTFDSRGIPFARGYVAGIDGCFELIKRELPHKSVPI